MSANQPNMKANNVSTNRPMKQKNKPTSRPTKQITANPPINKNNRPDQSTNNAKCKQDKPAKQNKTTRKRIGQQSDDQIYKQ
jgi:hypothetical protein